MDMVDNNRRTALITGSSAGIGAAFARVFAQNGFDLVLTARRKERLEELARELEEKHAISAHVIVADLADRETPQRIFDELNASGIHIDALVNNAGYGVPGLYRSANWETHRDFIQVLVTSAAHLAHLFEPGMVERDYGRIINIASLAGLVPASAGHTHYGAAKAFMIRFSQAHALEHGGTGVHVTALCPGFTYSEFHDVSGAREKVSKLPKYMWMEAEDVAQQGYEAVMRGDSICINGRVNRFIAFIAKYMPNWLTERITRSQSSKFRITDVKK